jgi:3-hydroxyisobutyrate dehydrogenase-like beta-hydroxyacid dehydrogenase
LQVDAFAESLALVTSAGVPAEKLTEVFQASMARSGVLDVKVPLMVKGEFPPSFPLRLMHKDVRLALELARELGVELPCGQAAYATYSAVLGSSRDDPDFSAVVRYWKH